jgi:hypothetical protein
MDDVRRRREQRKYRRIKNKGPNERYCRICGEGRWFVRYENHHIDGLHIFEDLIFICINCHEEVGEMIKYNEPLPEGIDPDFAVQIHRLRGQNAAMRMQIAYLDWVIEGLLGRHKFPDPRPVANDNYFAGRSRLTHCHPVPETTEPGVTVLIRMLRGIAEMSQKQVAANQRTIDWLLGRPILDAKPPKKPKPPGSESPPNVPVSNDNGGGNSSGGAAVQADRMAKLDAFYGNFPGLPSRDGGEQ